MSWLRSVGGSPLLILCWYAFLCTGCAVKSQSQGDATQYFLFKYQDSRAKQVSLVGDFNQWSSNAHKMNKIGNIWSIGVALKPGRYQYVFLVDGTVWQPDPEALMTEDTGFGTKNSVMIAE